jgi:hypothetical protein
MADNTVNKDEPKVAPKVQKAPKDLGPLSVAWVPGDTLMNDGWQNGHVGNQISVGNYPYARGKWVHLLELGKIDKATLEAYDKEAKYSPKK